MIYMDSAPARFLTRANVTGVPDCWSAHAPALLTRTRHVHERSFLVVLRIIRDVRRHRRVLALLLHGWFLRHSSRTSSFSRSSHLFHISGVDVIALYFLSGTSATCATGSDRGHFFIRYVRLVSRHAELVHLWVRWLSSRCSRCCCCSRLYVTIVVCDIIIVRCVPFFDVLCATMRLFWSILCRRRKHGPNFCRVFFCVFLYVRNEAGVRFTYLTTHGTPRDFMLFKQRCS